jgi:lysophospholipase L1-like esterase
VPTTAQGDACLRSDGNYPHLLAKRLDTTLDDVSCSGASTASLTGPQPTTTGEKPAQLDALHADTSLVTLGIGGNDEDLFTTIIGTCLQLAPSDPDGSPCSDELTAGGTDRLETKVEEIGARVRAALDEIATRAPEARVVVVGYPQAVPASGSCDALPLATGDYPYARGALEELSTALEKAAADAGVDYVDVRSASEGHDICAGDDAWVNGAENDPERALSFHPFAAEQQAVADLLVEQLQD